MSTVGGGGAGGGGGGGGTSNTTATPSTSIPGNTLNNNNNGDGGGSNGGGGGGGSTRRQQTPERRRSGSGRRRRGRSSSSVSSSTSSSSNNHSHYHQQNTAGLISVAAPAPFHTLFPSPAALSPQQQQLQQQQYINQDGSRNRSRSRGRSSQAAADLESDHMASDRPISGSGNWRGMMSISNLLRRDSDGTGLAPEFSSDTLNTSSFSSSSFPHPSSSSSSSVFAPIANTTTPTANNSSNNNNNSSFSSRNWLGSFLSRAAAGNELREVRPETPGDGFSPLLSRRSSSRQRRPDASTTNEDEGAYQSSSSVRLPWLSKKPLHEDDTPHHQQQQHRKSPGLSLANLLSGGVGNNSTDRLNSPGSAMSMERRKSYYSESESMADGRKSATSDMDTTSMTASGRSTALSKKKSNEGSDTEGEGGEPRTERKKGWKLFTRSNANNDELSMETQGRDKSRGRGAWFFTGGRNSPQPAESGSSRKPPLAVSTNLPPSIANHSSNSYESYSSYQKDADKATASFNQMHLDSTPSSRDQQHINPTSVPDNGSASITSSVSSLSLTSGYSSLRGPENYGPGSKVKNPSTTASLNSSSGPPDTGYQSDDSRKGTPPHGYVPGQAIDAIRGVNRQNIQKSQQALPGKPFNRPPPAAVLPQNNSDMQNRIPMAMRGLPLASQLILAAEHGQLETIRSLLDLGVSPSCRDENSTLLTPLIQAARHGHSDAVELLAKRGARLEDRDPDIGGTAVFHAAINGWYETVRVLINLGADSNAPEWTGCTPIFASSFHGHLEVVDILMACGASIDVPGPSGTPLHAAVEGRQLNVLKVLLSRCSDVDAVDAVGRTALWMASQSGLLTFVELLLEHGAQIDKPSAEGTRPLWTAIVNDHPEVAQRLVEHGADIHAPLPSGMMGGKPTGAVAPSSRGFTPLHGAAHRNHARLAHALIERGADATLEDDTQHTPLHLAAMMGNTAVVDVILWHCPHLLNSTSPTLQRTPLFLAALWNSMEVARLLIDYGADVEAISDIRTIRATALRAAVQGNHHTMVELLLTRGAANPNAKAADGSTCLHVAVSNGNVRIVGLLLSQHAEVDARLAGAGETPLHLATRRRKKVLDALRNEQKQAAAQPGTNLERNASASANLRAAASDNLTLIRLLLAANASINLSEDRAGLTPLHLASREGDLPTVTLLIAHGAHLEALTHSGFTALAIAALNGRYEVVRELLQCGASPFASSFEGVSVMHAAVMGVGIHGGGATAEASARILRLLLEAGADVDAVDARGDTPLGIASRAGNLYAVKVLVEAGASLDQLAWPKGVPPE